MSGDRRDDLRVRRLASTRRQTQLDANLDAAAAARPSSDLDLWAVRCLLVLTDERHYVRAAARLHISQPGLSRAIVALERRLGATLIVRGARPLALTPEGQIVASHGRQLLLQQQAARDEISQSLATRADPLDDASGAGERTMSA
jgi:hypothetical protein